MGPDLSLAHALADAADAISLARFRASDLVVETKPDLTPVTEADRAVESRDPRALARERPGRRRSSARRRARPATGRRRWIVDPIDGTRNYSRGIPVWATLIALEEDGELVLGLVSAPALGRRWWAERGAGAFADGEADPRLGRRARGGRRALLRARAGAASARAPVLASACLRRLLGAHARRRGGRRRCDRRGRRRRLGSRRDPADRGGGGRHVHGPRRASRGSTAAAPSRRTGSCTTRCSRDESQGGAAALARAGLSRRSRGRRSPPARSATTPRSGGSA